MPIDYLKQRQATEAKVSGLISGINPQDELMRKYSNITANRSKYIGAAQPAIQGLTSAYGIPGSRSSIPAKSVAMDKQTKANLMSQKFATTRTRQNMIFENAMALAQEYGMDLKSAEAYAREIVAQQSQQEFQAGENDKDRAAKAKRSEMASEYTQKGLDLEGQYQPDSDYAGAVLRVLTGTGTALGTSYFLNKRYSNNQTASPQTAPYGTTDQPYGPGYNQGYYPQQQRRPSGGYRY